MSCRRGPQLGLYDWPTRWHREWSVSAHVILKPPIRSPPKAGNFTWNVLATLRPTDVQSAKVCCPSRRKWLVMTGRLGQYHVLTSERNPAEQPVESETHSPAEGREEEVLVSNYSGSDGCE